MPKRHRIYEIETNAQRVTAYVRDVQEHADSNRDALGFLQGQAYEDAAQQGTLFVAVECAGDERRYAGHVLFGATYPHAKIYQTFVVTSARKQGLGKLLIKALIQYAENKQYLSVSARVAADLDANAFWASLNFEVVGTKSGGLTRGRTINVRARQLNTPALFGYREPVIGIFLTEPVPNFTAVFALDLNIFFDVLKHRPRSEFSAVVMTAAFNNIVRLAVTQEFANELRRTASPGQDPALEFALQLPTLSAPIHGLNASMLDKLAALVFPERAAAGKLSIQDQSDLRHLAIAAHHKITGFVTAEDALVRAGQNIQNQFGIRVIHVRDLADMLKNATRTPAPLNFGFADRDLCFSEVDTVDAPGIKRLVDSSRLPRELRNLALASGAQSGGRRSLAISFGLNIVAAAFWQSQSVIQGQLEAVMVVNEDDASSVVAVDALLNRLSRIASANGPARLHLAIPNAATLAQDVAIRCGFSRCAATEPEISRYQRLSIGTVVSEKSWGSIREKLRTSTDTAFSSALPSANGDQVRIHFESKEGKEFAIDVFDLETALSPTIFLLPDRHGVLVPIRAAYAHNLLDTGQQESLLPRPQAVMLPDRMYFSSPRNERFFRKGTPVIFYESSKFKGRSAAIAIARVKETIIVPKCNIASILIDAGVVDEEEISELSAGEHIAATTLDNIMKLKKPVPLKRLREFGCIDGANLVTSKSITSRQMFEIWGEGQGICE